MCKVRYWMITLILHTDNHPKRTLHEVHQFPSGFYVNTLTFSSPPYSYYIYITVATLNLKIENQNYLYNLEFINLTFIIAFKGILHYQLFFTSYYAHFVRSTEYRKNSISIFLKFLVSLSIIFIPFRTATF